MDKTEARIKLAIDAMGSDLGPSEILEGVAQAVDRSPWNTEFMLFGREEVVEPILLPILYYPVQRLNLYIPRRLLEWRKSL